MRAAIMRYISGRLQMTLTVNDFFVCLRSNSTALHPQYLSVKGSQYRTLTSTKRSRVGFHLITRTLVLNCLGGLEVWIKLDNTTHIIEFDRLRHAIAT